MALKNGRAIDSNGVLLNVLTVVLIFSGMFLGPVAVIAGFDPITQVVKAIFPKSSQTPLYKFTAYVVAYVLTQWCTLEASRIYITISIPTMTICNIYLRCLRIIGKRGLSYNTLLLYHQLHCLNQTGMYVIANIAGTLMGIGFVIMTLGNWIIFSAWNLVPFEVYALTFCITNIAYFIVVQTVPLAISCNECCQKLIEMWKVDIFQRKALIGYWKRKVEAQQPVSFYYAMSRFEKSTQVNYYSGLVNYTVNALILF